jgi:hypothetical protein
LEGTPILFTDLQELKTMLDIDPGDKSEDKKLWFFVEQASGLIEEICNRDFTYKSRTQYYNGTGTQKLLLRCRPVFPNPPSPFSALSVVYDSAGFFGSAPGAFTTSPTTQQLTYGTDYCLWIDQDDGTSRSAILFRINDYWWKPTRRQVGYLSPFIGDDTGSYQVSYTAGYTVDSLPSIIRQCANMLIATMRNMFPWGAPIATESYEEISMGLSQERKDYLLALAKPYIANMKNLKF